MRRSKHNKTRSNNIKKTAFTRKKGSPKTRPEDANQQNTSDSALSELDDADFLSLNAGGDGRYDDELESWTNLPDNSRTSNYGPTRQGNRSPIVPFSDASHEARASQREALLTHMNGKGLHKARKSSSKSARSLSGVLPSSDSRVLFRDIFQCLDYTLIFVPQGLPCTVWIYGNGSTGCWRLP